MIEGIKTLDDIEVKDKTLLLRIDINSPIDTKTRKIKDDTRIKRSATTIKELSDKGAKVIILAHQADPMDYQNFTLLKEHAVLLEKALEKKINYISDCVGPAAVDAIKNLKSGEILLLENIRIHTEETIIFEKEAGLSPSEQARTLLVSRLAPLADGYICDAFACVHRSEPSLVGFPEVLPSVCGRLFEEELKALSQVMKNPKRPCVFILGGAKILDAFKMMEKVLENGSADMVLTGGFVGEIMLKALGYNLGNLTEELIKKKNLLQFIEVAKKVLENYKEKVLYPEDLAGGKSDRKEFKISQLPIDSLITDIGQGTIKRYIDIIKKAGAIFMNGPAGVYENENSSLGTKEIWQAVGNSNAFTVIGGGDTIAASKKFGIINKLSYVSTAGGGLVRYISGEKVAVIEALKKCKK